MSRPRTWVAPIYWYIWKNAQNHDYDGARRSASGPGTVRLWFNFLVGHVLNNVRGFGSMNTGDRHYHRAGDGTDLARRLDQLHGVRHRVRDQARTLMYLACEWFTVPASPSSRNQPRRVLVGGGPQRRRPGDVLVWLEPAVADRGRRARDDRNVGSAPHRQAHPAVSGVATAAADPYSADLFVDAVLDQVNAEAVASSSRQEGSAMNSKLDLLVIVAAIASGGLLIERHHRTVIDSPAATEMAFRASAPCPDNDNAPYSARCISYMEGYFWSALSGHAKAAPISR